jgi:hypothetical protein
MHFHTGSYRIEREIVQFGDGPPDPSLEEVIVSLRAAAARTPVDTRLWVPVGGEGASLQREPDSVQAADPRSAA